MSRADYQIVAISGGIVFLVDLDRGGRSVTNAAEQVRSDVMAQHPGARVVYRDSMGRWDEILADAGGVFFAPYRGAIPETAHAA